MSSEKNAVCAPEYGNPQLTPVLLREGGEGEQVGRRFFEQRRGFGEARLELLDDPSVLLMDRLGVGLREDRADHRRDEALRALRHSREQVAHRVCAAALPGGAGQGRGDRVDEAWMRVACDQADAAEAAGDERAQKGEPGSAVFGGDDVEADDSR